MTHDDADKCSSCRHLFKLRVEEMLLLLLRLGQREPWCGRHLRHQNRPRPRSGWRAGEARQWTVVVVARDAESMA